VAALWHGCHIFAAIQPVRRNASVAPAMSEHILWVGAMVCFVIALAIIAFTV